MDQPEECTSCYWPTEDLHHVDDYPSYEGWHCKVCFSTLAGNAARNPRQYDNTPLMQTVAWGINYLASLIQEQGRRVEA